jgi:outer membrane protein TolC
MLKTCIKILVFQAGITFSCFSQDTISLSYCLDKTGRNHPRSGNSEIISNITEAKISNIRSGYLPQMELNGKASYQSDVISLGMNIPGITIPTSPRDQYKLSLDLTQSIYDGGFVKSRQKIEEVSEQVDKSMLDLDIHASKMQVKELYYNILLNQNNQEIVDITLRQLIENRGVIETGIKNGTLLSSDLDLLDVEIIKLQQRKSELENLRITGLQVLAYKMDENFNLLTVLRPTYFALSENDSIQRLEDRLFELQSIQLGQNKALVKSRSLPKIFAFGQFGYGNPALNMLKDEFDTYYVVGAGLKWTIWDWKINSREKEVIGLQQSIIQSRQNQFESEINSALMNQKSIIRNHQENLLAYENILVLRSRISATSKAQLEQGIIKTLDYISVLNQETIARIQFETEKTLLQQAIAKYLEIKGEL